MDKAALVATMVPLPKCFSGSTAVVNPQSRITGDVAILRYDLDEKEDVFGQERTARYHGTDTGVRLHGWWRALAGQIFRHYADPKPGKASLARYRDYARVDRSRGDRQDTNMDSDVDHLPGLATLARERWTCGDVKCVQDSLGLSVAIPIR